jgi:hypothetical protein
VARHTFGCGLALGARSDVPQITQIPQILDDKQKSPEGHMSVNVF